MEPSKLGSDCLDGRLTKTQLAQLEDLMLTPHFKGLGDDLRYNEEKWVQMYENGLAETMVPEPWF